MTVSRSSRLATNTNNSKSRPATATRTKRTIGVGTRNTRGWASAASRRIASSFVTSVGSGTVIWSSTRLEVSA